MPSRPGISRKISAARRRKRELQLRTPARLSQTLKELLQRQRLMVDRQEKALASMERRIKDPGSGPLS